MPHQQKKKSICDEMYSSLVSTYSRVIGSCLVEHEADYIVLPFTVAQTSDFQLLVFHERLSGVLGLFIQIHFI